MNDQKQDAFERQRLYIVERLGQATGISQAPPDYVDYLRNQVKVDLGELALAELDQLIEDEIKRQLGG